MFNFKEKEAARERADTAASCRVQVLSMLTTLLRDQKKITLEQPCP